LWRCAGVAAARWGRCLRGGIGEDAGARAGGSCRGRGWRICRIGEGQVGRFVVGGRIAAAAAAAAAAFGFVVAC
jgi:hypothetical protein